ncbi:hypothetical protein B7494_g1109 [Chlorociboria aeruginascens]|nr:hypothetical protein B7494_g1109 [Chlorociboria aeruginascens]
MAILTRILSELGLRTLYYSPRDTKFLCIQRLVRMFAYGSSTLILVAYLSSLLISKPRIGLFMTLTMVGDTIISFFLTLFADRLGRRRTLMMGALLMVGSGVVFALSGDFWVLLVAAILGVISPGGNEIGPFRAIEESTLAQLIHADHRSDIYAWYSMIGPVGAALGMMATGWGVTYMREHLRWGDIEAYRTVFWGYAIFGLLKFTLVMGLSKNVEVVPKEVIPGNTETAPLLNNENGHTEEPKKKRSWIPDISNESRVIVTQICILFTLDSFASGATSLSWVTYFFHTKFNLEEGKLGSLFFTTSIVSALSMLIASSISKRFGNINTMVFTHLPSSIFLSLVPAPSTLFPAMIFLFLRSCTQQMDVPPRAAFLAAVILPHERTAAMGLINVVKTSSQSLGPLLSGFLAAEGKFWIAFVVAGCMKATYDLGMLAVFRGYRSREERVAEERRAAEEGEEGQVAR